MNLFGEPVRCQCTQPEAAKCTCASASATYAACQYVYHLLVAFKFAVSLSMHTGSCLCSPAVCLRVHTMTGKAAELRDDHCQCASASIYRVV